MAGCRCASFLMSIVPNLSDRTATTTYQNALTSVVVLMHRSSRLEDTKVPQAEPADLCGGHVAARIMAARSLESADLG